MHPSLLLLFAVPAVLLLGVLAKVGTGIVRALWHHKVPPTAPTLGFFAGLLAIDGVLSLLVILNAAISHSERAKAASLWYCIGIFLLLVALPAAAVSLRIRRIRASTRAASLART